MQTLTQQTDVLQNFEGDKVKRITLKILYVILIVRNLKILIRKTEYRLDFLHVENGTHVEVIQYLKFVG